MSGHHHQRVTERIARELASLVAAIRDPRVGFVTLTDVRLSPDLRHARVYVTVRQGADDEAIRALNHAAPFLRRELARAAGLRYTPELRFARDEVEESAERVDRLLDRIHAERDGEERGD